jgi:hypothetical protein
MSQINALPINGFTIADLALLAPGPGQFLEVGGATEGRIDIDALAAYARLGAGAEAEIITNANGTAIRFPGIGIQICTWNEATPRTTSTNWGFLFISGAITATFPAAFSEPPMVLGAPLSLSVDGNTGAWISAINPTTSSVTLVGVSGFSFVVLRLGYIAIGTYTP